VDADRGPDAQVTVVAGGASGIGRATAPRFLRAGARGRRGRAVRLAVINFTANSAVELAAHRIRVKAISPGLVNPPLVMRKDPVGNSAFPGY
jgi:NAD(P)-dependent dehydrogenase (short-subunit alcohol dehydrogenase family)